jgi:ferredoxin
MPVIRFLTSGKEIEFPEGEEVNVLRISLRHDLGLPWSCASGLCGTDRITIVEGGENLSGVRRRERDRLGELLDDDVRLACQTYTSGDLAIAWDPEQKGIDEDSRAGKRLKTVWLEGTERGDQVENDGSNQEERQ